MKKAALHNLGCKVNAYETQAMQQLLEAAGYEIVAFHEKADVYVINTCSVTNIADRKSRQMLHRARRQNPQAVIVAAGCYVQTAGPDVGKEGIADIILGNNKKEHLVSMIERYQREQATVTDWEDVNQGKKEYERLAVSRAAGHTRAFLKIQDGCNQFCSYCVIPYARGRVRSRRPQEVLEEVRRLAASGCKEIVLTGIHLSSYGMGMDEPDEKLQKEHAGFDLDGSPQEGHAGFDLDGSPQEGHAGFDLDGSPQEGHAGFDLNGSPQKRNACFDPDGPRQELLQLLRLIHEVDGICRIRLGSLEPGIITRPFAQALAGMEKICPHFHLSLQSGCDTVLDRMNRKYHTAEFAEKCEILRACFDRPAITTDVIVGFPGETEAEFAATREFLEQVHFYEMHIFKYSVRKGTRAAAMDGQVAEPVKAARSAQLLALGERMSAQYREGFAGEVKDVLLEEPFVLDGRRYEAGYTKEYVKVAVVSEQNRANCVVRGEITGHLTRDIYLMVEF